MSQSMLKYKWVKVILIVGSLTFKKIANVASQGFVLFWDSSLLSSSSDVNMVPAFWMLQYYF